MLKQLGSFVLLGLLAVVGCARGITSTPLTSGSAVPSPAPATSGSQPSGSTSGLNPANLINVNAGANTSADITVVSAAGTENATSLGTLANGFAANTGVIVHPASSNTLVLFGAGLSGNMSVTISGPSDIGVSNIRSIQAKDGTPGIAFDAVVGSSTALGARTVYLKSSNNDVTAFTGGLEVQP